MDFDSSAKFISSLAKFLQSLCNGYVEFDNGVEVIGHIYLNVDTGKKIDYVLNEKVCKTDENSVTFISNSFHAQPAEKPKPVEKPKQSVPSEPDIDDNEIILMDDPDKGYDQYSHSDNAQQHNSTPHPKSKRSHGASKRSYNQSFSSSPSSSKISKYDSTSHPNGAHISSNNSANDSSFNLNLSSNITAASESDLSHLSQVFPENVNPSNAQDRDVKPVFDKDLNVINVKQEYDPSDGPGGGNNTYDEQGDGSYYTHDQSYESSNEQYYGSGHQDSSRKDYDSMSSKMYLEAGSSGSAGDTQDQYHHQQVVAMWKPGEGCPVFGCHPSTSASIIHKFTTLSSFRRHWKSRHRAFVVKYFCSFCDTSSKRKEGLEQHYRMQHNVQDTVDMDFDRVDEERNVQFVDPSPLTLDIVLGRKVKLNEFPTSLSRR